MKMINKAFTYTIFKPESPCMLWAWYLSDDMQFFLLSLIVIFIFYKSRKFGYLIILIVFAGMLTASFLVSYHFWLSNSFLRYDQKFFKYYCATYIRYPAYLVGLVSGLMYFHWRKEGAFQKQIIYLQNNKTIRTMISIVGIYP